MNDSSCCDEPCHDSEPRQTSEKGQATAEYALLTGVVALIIALWAAGTGKVGQLLDVVFDGLIRAAG